MCRPRHIAISVPELCPAAAFYKKTFGLEGVIFDIWHKGWVRIQ